MDENLHPGLMVGICSESNDNLGKMKSPQSLTVNPEIFARILFSRNFAYAKFRENKTLAKWHNNSVIY